MKKIERENSWKTKLIDNEIRRSFVLKSSRKLGQMVSMLRFSNETLLAHLSNKIVQAEISQKRGKHFLGRIYNKMAGENSEEVLLDGIVVLQLYEVLGEDAEFPIEPAGQYSIGLEALTDHYHRATAKI